MKAILFLMAATLFACIGCHHDPYAEIKILSDRVDESPAPERIVDLLEYRSDGAFWYYHKSMVGRCFATHPEAFAEVVAMKLSDRAKARIEELVAGGEGNFEYHPEVRPDDFASHFASEPWVQEWRTRSAPATDFP